MQSAYGLFGADPGTTLAEFEQLLVSNAGEDPFDTAVTLLAAKLLDEQEIRAGKVRSDFTTAGTPKQVHDRVTALCRRALALWPELNGAGDMTLPPEQLARCLRPLVGWCMLDTDLSQLDAVLERLVARSAKGALGQYFTPREVVRLCVAVVNPVATDHIIDPACGSGGFLFEAARHCRLNTGSTPKCLGVDIGARSLKVAALLARATADSMITITKGNSIDGREYQSSYPEAWESFLSRESGLAKEPNWGAWSRLRATLLLTNPPFAGAIDDPAVLLEYEAQRSSGATKRTAVGREHLFLERAVKMLAPGGRLAIVLPQGLLVNSSSEYLRRWLVAQGRLLAVVGLHQHAFLPYTNVKTSILFFDRPHLRPPEDYPVAFAVSRLPGKDSSGRKRGESDYASVADQIGDFFHTLGYPWAAYKRCTADNTATSVPIRQVMAQNRFDAEFYDGTVITLSDAITTKSSVTVGEVVATPIERFKKGVYAEIDYIDISSVDLRTGIPQPTRMRSLDAPSRASYILRAGDVLVSTVRPERNIVAYVTSTGDAVPTVASNGFCVLRAVKVPPEVLYAWCKTEVFRRLLSRHATATMYPAVTDDDVLRMPLVVPGRRAEEEIVCSLRSGLRHLQLAHQGLADAVRYVETAVTKGTSEEESVAETAGEWRDRRSRRRQAPKATRKKRSDR